MSNDVPDDLLPKRDIQVNMHQIDLIPRTSLSNKFQGERNFERPDDGVFAQGKGSSIGSYNIVS